MILANVERARNNMIQQQIRPWSSIDDGVLEIMQAIPREDFVPAAYRELAFADVDITLDEGLCMVSPKLGARMLHSLAVKPGDNILEIGTGSGYLTACLARLGGYVTSMDRDPARSAASGKQLARQGINNVSLIRGGLEKIPGGSFDVILLSGGSMPIRHPQLESALTLGGRLFAVIGVDHLMEACLITRMAEDIWQCDGLFETALPALNGSIQTSGFEF
jgi:protein-L-isoaspartate(D-aspartate) O-methyltransferase